MGRRGLYCRSVRGGEVAYLLFPVRGGAHTKASPQRRLGSYIIACSHRSISKMLAGASPREGGAGLTIMRVAIISFPHEEGENGLLLG